MFSGAAMFNWNDRKIDIIFKQTLNKLMSKTSIKGKANTKRMECDDFDSQQSLFLPEEVVSVKKLKKQCKKPNYKEKAENRPKRFAYNKSTWSLAQNLAYKDFLACNLSYFQKELQERRALRINILMSSHVKTRSSTQCRSHHQKMVKYYKDIPSIIAFIECLEARHNDKNNVQIKEKSEAEINITLSLDDAIMEMQETPMERSVSFWESACLGNWHQHLDF